MLTHTGIADDSDTGLKSAGAIRIEAEVELNGTLVTLAPPTLTADLTGQQQRTLIDPLLQGLAFNQFARDSVVAPVRINLQYIKDDAGNRIGHAVHLLFIVHENLAAFSQQDLVARMIGQPQGEQPDPSSKLASSLSEDMLRERGIDDMGDDVRYQELTFDLLDKIEVTAVFRIAQTTSSTQNRIDVRMVPQFANRWRPIDRSATERDAQGGAYSGFQGWLTATSLEGMNAVFIEARMVMHEPSGWFTGDNHLRSKLPLVLQEAARDLRRKLKATSAESPRDQ